LGLGLNFNAKNSQALRLEVRGGMSCFAQA
jgi:hypothetical protein